MLGTTVQKMFLNFFKASQLTAVIKMQLIKIYLVQFLISKVYNFSIHQFTEYTLLYTNFITSSAQISIDKINDMLKRYSINHSFKISVNILSFFGCLRGGKVGQNLSKLHVLDPNLPCRRFKLKR